MILIVKEQFCTQHQSDEEIEEYIQLYNDNKILFSRGYMKLCVLKQEIYADEDLAKKLFYMWPGSELDIKYYYSDNFSLSIKPKIY